MSLKMRGPYVDILSNNDFSKMRLGTTVIGLASSLSSLNKPNTRQCCYLSLGCLLEAHIRSGLLPPGLRRASPAVLQTCCPVATCKRCPGDCGAFSRSLTWNNPRSSPCPPLWHNPPNSLTLCGPSLAESAKAKGPARRKRTEICVSENGNCRTSR